MADPAANPTLDAPARPPDGPPSGPPDGPVEVSNDLDDYTNGEIEDLEDALGKLIAEVFVVGKPIPRKAANGLLWLTLRRADQAVTLADVRAMQNSSWVWKPPDPPSAPAAPSGRDALPPSAPSTG